MENKKTLLSVKDLVVKFRVRGRILTAIRGISLDIYENESIAIVGESGSGKSVFTKTFAGMLDSNGFIDNGSIIFSDDELADTVAPLDKRGTQMIDAAVAQLNEYARLENGAATYAAIQELEREKQARFTLSAEQAKAIDDEIADTNYRRTELFNQKQTLDTRKEKDEIRRMTAEIKALDAKVKELEANRKRTIAENQQRARNDAAYNQQYAQKLAELKQRYAAETAQPIDKAVSARNQTLAEEMYLSVSRYPAGKRAGLMKKLLAAMKQAMTVGVDLNDEEQRNNVFDTVVFRVSLLDKNDQQLHGKCVMNLAKVRYPKDWLRIRGGKIATVFQDPMTSLNPIITIGKQITSVIIKHQGCTEVEARTRALELMNKVGIPNAEKRFDDYPFQYSGGMRQRIVIAIALSCQPKILICDEPTTALDVTIQAQILKLLKDLQKEFNYTIVFITHDLGVVANVADRVAVLYAGQIVELGKVEEVFYDPRHPYTWALLSSLPQLAQRNTELFSITGTPPSLYNSIVGDPFAPRNPYCMKIDTLKEPPTFQITETHFAKTWLLDPRSPRIEKPEAIQDIHEKLMKAFNI